MEVAAYILNEQLCTADKRWYPSWWLGGG